MNMISFVNTWLDLSIFALILKVVSFGTVYKPVYILYSNGKAYHLMTYFPTDV